MLKISFTFQVLGFTFLGLHPLFRVFGHGDEYGDQFVGFPPNRFNIVCRDTAIILQEFQP